MQTKGQLLDATPDTLAGPAPLLLCMTGVDPLSVQARLRPDGPLTAPTVFTPSAVLSAVADGERKAVVIFCTAEDFLVAAMDAARAPGEALAEWIDAAAGILQARSQSRRQISLIRDVHFLDGARNGLGALEDLVGAARSVEDRVPDAEPVYRVLARQVVTESPRAQELGLDLEASALPWSRRAETLDLDAIYLGHRALVAGDGKLEDAAALEAMLRDQVAQLQDEIVGRVQQAGLDRANAQSRLASLTEASERDRAEILELKATIEALQKTIKQLGSEVRQAQDARQVAQRHSASLEAERATVFNSTSWKITRPLRAAKEVFGGSTGKKIV